MNLPELSPGQIHPSSITLFANPYGIGFLNSVIEGEAKKLKGPDSIAGVTGKTAVPPAASARGAFCASKANAPAFIFARATSTPLIQAMQPSATRNRRLKSELPRPAGIVNTRRRKTETYWPGMSMRIVLLSAFP